MTKSASKFYVVWVGAKPGVYATWKDCQLQVKGVEGARFMAFPNQAQAEYAFKDNMWKYLGKKTVIALARKAGISGKGPVWESISVDAACSGNPGLMEYQGVFTKTGERIFYKGPYPDATNNIGEFLAIVHALALQKQQGKSIPIYSDSQTAISWVKNKHAKTKLEQTTRNNEVFDLIQRAEAWLKTHSWDIPVYKWETENWGEIPADFGRK